MGALPLGPSVELPIVRGVPKWAQWCHGSAATGTFGGAPYGATVLVRGVPKWGFGEPRDARGPSHWDLRKHSVWGQGHDRREVCAEMKLRLALGGASYGARGTILARGMPKLCLGTHWGPGTGTFGKAPYGVWAWPERLRMGPGPRSS